MGGNLVTATITLAAAAGSGGAVISLTSSNTAAATVPASVTVSEGSTTATFEVDTSAVTQPVDVIYTPELNLLAETQLTTSATPPVEWEYVWFGGQPVAQIETATNTIAWYFNDHLGTPVLQTAASANVIWRVEREPFGKTFEVRVGAARHQPLAFPGQEEQGGETSYNIFRWYRSGWGRYTQADPMGVGGRGNLASAKVAPVSHSKQFGDAHLYRYALNSPTILFDPLGLDTQVVLWGGAGGGTSSFGHASVIIDGVSYSFAPGGMTVGDASAYIDRQNFRFGFGLHLDLTQGQEHCSPTI